MVFLASDEAGLLTVKLCRSMATDISQSNPGSTYSQTVPCRRFPRVNEPDYLAGADAAGLVLGARVPIILTSRADSLKVRLASAALAKLVGLERTKSPA